MLRQIIELALSLCDEQSLINDDDKQCDITVNQVYGSEVYGIEIYEIYIVLPKTTTTAVVVVDSRGNQVLKSELIRVSPLS